MIEQNLLPIPNLLLMSRTDDNPDRPFLLGSDRPSLSYSAFSQQMIETVDTLNRLGLGRHDRVALLMPNGPDLIAALITLACGTSCLVLDQNATQVEYETLLRRAGIQALIYQPATD